MAVGAARVRRAIQKFSRGLSRLSLLRTLTSSALPPLLLSSTDLWTSKADGTEKESVWVMTRSLLRLGAGDYGQWVLAIQQQRVDATTARRLPRLDWDGVIATLQELPAEPVDGPV